MDYLQQLNPAQREAVLHQAGPLLIVAGAGAGKTKTITHRIYHLIKSGIAPHQILAITFTNKAAAEMRERVLHLLKQDGYWDSVPMLSTFHSLCVQILRENSQHLGLNKYFNIIDKDEGLSLIKSILKDTGMGESVEPRKVLGAISREKNRGYTVEEYLAENKPDYWHRLLAQVWPHYQARLKAGSGLDFDDLLLRTVRLLETNDTVRHHYQTRWEYIHIDEYQDTNTIQYTLAQLLAAKHRNICVVGDMDQAIYAWRGADYRNLWRFTEDYRDAKVVTLEENYRSTQTILAAANQVIAKNIKRQDKKLFTKQGAGEKIKVLLGLTEVEEAQNIAETASDLVRQGVAAEDIAVLYRTNFQSRVLEEAFLRAGVAYQVIGTRFFDRKEIKDLLAFVKAALNPEDIENFKRIINIPPRGIGKVTLAKMFSGQEESLPAATRAKIMSLRTMLAEIKDMALKAKPAETIKFVLERTGINEWLQTGPDKDLERLANLKELVSLAVKYDNVPPGEGIWLLLTEAALVADQDEIAENKVGVRLMTVHAAKGLEFKHVFVSGLEEGLFPLRFSGDDNNRDDEEERRLFYVAITRAKERLYLSYAASRRLYGNTQTTLPSEFLMDIDDELLEASTISTREQLIDF